MVPSALNSQCWEDLRGPLLFPAVTKKIAQGWKDAVKRSSLHLISQTAKIMVAVFFDSPAQLPGNN